MQMDFPRKVIAMAASLAVMAFSGAALAQHHGGGGYAGGSQHSSGGSSGWHGGGGSGWHGGGNSGWQGGGNGGWHGGATSPGFRGGRIGGSRGGFAGPHRGFRSFGYYPGYDFYVPPVIGYYGPSYYGYYGYPYYDYDYVAPPPVYYYDQQPLAQVTPPPPPPPRPTAPSAAPVPQPAPLRTFERYTLSASELFAFDRSELMLPQPKLDEIASALIANPQIGNVRISGYTDRLGSDSYNLQLSQRRANAVKQYLVSKGVAASRLAAIGRGKADPVVSCNQKQRAALIDCLAPNRRVVVEQITVERPR